MIVLYTGVQVAGLPSAQGSVRRQVLDVIGTCTGSVLFTVAFVLAMLPVAIRADKLRQAQAVPRPRWQYLVIAGGWIAMAGGLIACGMLSASMRVGSGWLARACGGFAVWFLVFGLFMIGRAACSGGVRDVFWWYRPLWIPDTATTPLTPPPAPARRANRRGETDHQR